MSDERSRGNPLQVAFLVLGVILLGVALFVALSRQSYANGLGMMGTADGRETVLIFSSGFSALFFILATFLHVKH